MTERTSPSTSLDGGSESTFTNKRPRNAPARPAGGLVDPLSIEYLAWCRSEGIPATTVRRRAVTLRLFGTAGTATREDLEAWWTSRAERQPATRANDLATLRAFYRWCAIWEHRTDDPTRRIRPPKVPNGLPSPVTEVQLRHLLETFRDGRPDVFRAVVLGARQGLRRDEAAGLTWSSIDEPSQTMTVRGKGSKARRIVVTEEVLEQLGPPAAASCSVVTGTTEFLTADALGARVNRAMKAAGVQATFHKLRHRAGTVAYQSSRDLLAVSRFMGHASISTTTVYAAAADDAARSIAAAL